MVQIPCYELLKVVAHVYVCQVLRRNQYLVSLQRSIAIRLNFKSALDSEKVFEASHCVKQERKTNRNSPGPNLYERVDREDDYTPEEAEGECLQGKGELMKDYII
ncbi:hypothetical protein BC332_10691 [Capsicum chinense]|nr:hypothetical protein BC332_10691 [Capsicum chinense]